MWKRRTADSEYSAAVVSYRELVRRVVGECEAVAARSNCGVHELTAAQRHVQQLTRKLARHLSLTRDLLAQHWPDERGRCWGCASRLSLRRVRCRVYPTLRGFLTLTDDEVLPVLRGMPVDHAGADPSSWVGGGRDRGVDFIPLQPDGPPTLRPVYEIRATPRGQVK